MAAGLQCWDASGNLVVDVTSRLARVQGSAVVDPSRPTSVSVADSGQVWFAFQPQGIWGFTTMNVLRPIFTVSGRTISWTWSASAGANPYTITGTMFYGAY